MAETGCPHALVKTVPLRADGWQGPSATRQPSTSDGPVTNDRTDRFDGPSPGIVGSGDFVAGSASPSTRRCPPMAAATSATKATDPTEAPRSCGGLGHTSTCRGTRAMSRRRCRGSRALADDRTHATESTELTIHRRSVGSGDSVTGRRRRSQHRVDPQSMRPKRRRRPTLRRRPSVSPPEGVLLDALTGRSTPQAQRFARLLAVRSQQRSCRQRIA